MTGPITVGGDDVRRTVSEGRVLAIAAFGAFLAFVDATIVNVAFPSIQAEFPDAEISSLSWVLNSYNIVFAAALVAGGRLADLIGRRRAFRLGVSLFTVASVLCAVAWSVNSLIAFRCVQAVGAAVLVPASLAVVVEAASRERRAHAVGLWGGAAAAAGGLGPPIGGALVELSDWRLTFLVNLPLGIAAILATRAGLVESRAPGQRSLPDLPGTGYLAVALGAVTLGLIQGPEWGWTSWGVLGAFLLAVGATVALVHTSRRHPSPILDPQLLRIRTFAVANALTVVAGAGFYAYLLTNILWLTYVWDWSVLQAGLAVAPGAFVAAAVAGFFGKLADRYGARAVVIPGAFVWASSFLWYITMVGTEPAFLTEWLPGQILSGIGIGATLPVLGSAGSAAIPGGRYATAAAALSSARQLGGAIGIAVLVVVIGDPTVGIVDALRDGWTLTAVCFLTVGLGSFLLGRTRIDTDEGVALGEARVEVGASDALDSLRHLAALSGGTATTAAADRAGRPKGRTASEGLFASLPPGARERLTARAKRELVPAGRWLFHQGDRADAMYVVASGRLEVLAGGVLVSELGAGAVVGELGVLTGAPRAASVRARRDTEVLKVSRRMFDTVMTDDPRAARKLATALAAQVQASRPTVEPQPAQPSVVAVVGLVQGAPTAQVAELLTAELRRHVTVATPGRPDVAALERAERRHDRVVLMAAGDDEQAWRTFCLGQADHVVLVAAGPHPPGGRPHARAGADLVVPGGTPTTAQLEQWYAAVDPRRVYTLGDLREQWDSAIAPLARRIAGRSVGLALAGGGARAFAHIGVIDELLAAGVEVDRVSGCSVGAVIAALFAAGLDADAIDARVYDGFVRVNPFGDYTVPKVALTRGQRTRTLIDRAFGDLLIEQLPRELVTVSTDLLARELVVHDRGLVRHAVAASLSLPALFPPYRLDGRLLVDGGVLDNLPVEPLAVRNEGPIIAVQIGSTARSQAGEDGPATPALGESLMRVLLMSSAAALAKSRRQAAVVVTPDTRGVGLLEFHQIDRLREAGRAAARAALAELGMAPERS